MDLSSINIILGSASPRRKQLLEGLGWDIEVRVKSTSEEIPSHLKRAEIAIYLAEMKAVVFDDDLKKNELLITADTIVCKDDEILNKPTDEQDAFRMLRSLSDREHQVYTGVALTLNGVRNSFSVESTVYFRNLNDEEIQNYIAKFKPFDKAGAYGAQECLPEGMDPCSQEEKDLIKTIGKPNYFHKSLNMGGMQHVPVIRLIEGSYFNVMGLPVVQVWIEIEKRLKK